MEDSLLVGASMIIGSFASSDLSAPLATEPNLLLDAYVGTAYVFLLFLLHDLFGLLRHKPDFSLRRWRATLVRIIACQLRPAFKSEAEAAALNVVKSASGTPEEWKDYKASDFRPITSQQAEVLQQLAAQHPVYAQLLARVGDALVRGEADALGRVCIEVTDDPFNVFGGEYSGPWGS